MHLPTDDYNEALSELLKVRAEVDHLRADLADAEGRWAGWQRVEKALRPPDEVSA